METVNAIGRRKTAVARVYLNEGKGKILVNKRDFAEYFPVKVLQAIISQPLRLTNVGETFDIRVNLRGGGITGQAEALRMAIARALIKINPENRKVLKVNGLLTRDSRKVERKKPGRPGARKRFQFSKR